MRTLGSALLFFTGVVCAQEPVQVSALEVQNHRAGQLKSIHSDTQSDSPFEGVTLQVIVGVNGKVESARAVNGANAFFDAAEKLEAKRTFTPFERGGTPVRATLSDYVSIYPPENWSDTGVPFPEVKDWGSLTMRLKRTGCFGPCPAYSVEVHGDGTVEFAGLSNVLVTGHHRSQIAKQSVKDLITEFRKANYFALRDEYVATITDNSTYTTTIEFDGTSKSVQDYVGTRVGMPEVVRELEDSIDGIAGTEKWVKGNEQTGPALLAESYDFRADTEQNRALFARVVARGSEDLIRVFALNGAPALAMTKSGEGALVSAAGKGDLELVKLLLDQEAQPPVDVLTCALGAAAGKGSLPVVQFLIEKGALPNGSLCGKPENTTVLMKAARSGEPEVIEEVLKYHPAIRAKDEHGSTALNRALERGVATPFNPKGLELLVAAGADVNSRNINQQTPIFDACRNDDREAIPLLVKAGANVNAKDRNGQTVLMSCFSIEALKVLISAGADLTVVNDRGQTAAQQARETGAINKADLLESAMQQRSK